MSDKIQILRRIGACENKQAQPDWKGPAIPPCSEPPAYLCETCGRLLCGGHAGGHWHAASDAATLASHTQDEMAQAKAGQAAAEANAAALQSQLTAAQVQTTKLAKVRELLG